MPDSLKTGQVTPLLKKPGSDTSDLNNFRPVSNLPLLAKIMEKCVLIQLTQHLDSTSLLDPHQSGFRKGSSTETAILNVIDDMHKSLDKGQCCLLILLDLSAAFDTVDHKRLIRALQERAGAEEVVLQWFSSFLQNRTQSIKIKNFSSDPRPVHRGVPQGSVLSPQLFNIYMQPLTTILRKNNIPFHLYADDTQIYLEISSIEDIQRLNATLKEVQDWLSCNHLKLNQDKTEFLLISNKEENPQLKVWIKAIDALNLTPTPADSVKSLGITLDPRLDMGKHIKITAKSALFHLKLLYKIKPHIPQRDLKQATQALVLSRLDYGIATLSGTAKSQLAPLRATLNAAARMVTGGKKYDHISPALRELKWLPIDMRANFRTACLTHKALHTGKPAYLAAKLQKAGQSRNLRSTNTLLLIPPKSRSHKNASRSFSGNAPKIWNSIPVHIRTNTSFLEFKKQLKDLLLMRSLPYGQR